MIHQPLSTWTTGSFCYLARIFFVVLLLAPLLAESASPLPSGVIKTLQKHQIPTSDVSVYLKKVSDNSPTLTLNASVPRNPASVMKLLTSLVALDTLGPNYHWRTEAYIHGTLSKGVLDGDLILKGYGDPYLTPERFWQFLYTLRERGIRQIQGDLVIDSSYFLSVQEDRGDFDGKPYRAYNALPHPLSLNFQATKLHLLPDRNETAVHAFTYPPLANLQIDNRLKPVSGPCQTRHYQPTVHVSERNDGATLDVRGNYSIDCPEWSNVYLIMDPKTHLAGTFMALWSELGGKFNGKVKSGLIPQGSELFHRMESRPLAEVIRSMNKFSNNLMSRMLLLTVGAETRGAPAKITQVQSFIADWLKKQRVASGMVRVSNGSGLSRKGQLSAETIGQLLQFAYESPYMPEFMASLPIAGIDGTMRKRLRKSGLAGRAHIKTGSLNDVSTMAGYVLDRHNQRWVVTMLINHPGVQGWQGRQVQDALLRWVYRGPEGYLNGAGQIVDGTVPECNDPLYESRPKQAASKLPTESARRDASQSGLL